MIIVRQTFWWKKEFDNISLSQLIEKSWLSKKSVLKALEALENYNLIIRTQNKSTAKSGKDYFTSTTYSLLFYEEEAKNTPGGNFTPTQNNSEDTLGEILHQHVEEKYIPTGRDTFLPIQERDSKNTNIQQQTEMLLKFNIRKDILEGMLETYTFERIKDVVDYIEKEGTKISNREWFLFDALKNWYEFNLREKEIKQQKDLKRKQEIQIEQQNEAKRKMEDFKKQQVEMWKAENYDEYLEIFDQEKQKLSNSPAGKNDFLAEINSRVRIRKEILGLD